MDKAINKKLRSMGLFKFSEVRKKGISQPVFFRWVNKGLIRRISRGLYIHPQSSILIMEYLDFAAACSRFGTQSAIGGLSALFYYRLIEQAPQQVWVVVPSSCKDESNQKKYKCLRTQTPLNIGIDKKKYFRITNIDRTLIETMKFSTKIGKRIVISSARKALQEGLTTEKKLAQMASYLKMKSVLEKYWEAIVL